MKWKELKTEEASNLFQEYCVNKTCNYSGEYNELRRDLCILFESVLNDLGI